MSKPNHVINDDELNQFPRCATRQRSPEIDAEEGQDPKRDNADDGHSSHHIGNVHARTEEGHNQTKQTTRLLAKQNKKQSRYRLGQPRLNKNNPDYDGINNVSGRNMSKMEKVNPAPNTTVVPSGGEANGD